MEAAICEAVDEAESDCGSENDEDDPLPILMNSTYLATTLVHGTTLYNLLPVCVCVCLHYLNKH